MHRFRVQSESAGATEEGRNALRPPQTHPRPGTAPITRSMRRSRRIYPRRHRPKPPETRKAQTDGACRKLKRPLCLRHLNQISAVAQTDAPKSKTFSTKSALSCRSLRGGAERLVDPRTAGPERSGWPSLAARSCRSWGRVNAAAQPVVSDI